MSSYVRRVCVRVCVRYSITPRKFSPAETELSNNSHCNHSKLTHVHRYFNEDISARLLKYPWKYVNLKGVQ